MASHYIGIEQRPRLFETQPVQEGVQAKVHPIMIYLTCSKSSLNGQSKRDKPYLGASCNFVREQFDTFAARDNRLNKLSQIRLTKNTCRAVRSKIVRHLKYAKVETAIEEQTKGKPIQSRLGIGYVRSIVNYGFIWLHGLESIMQRTKPSLRRRVPNLATGRAHGGTHAAPFSAHCKPLLCLGCIYS